MKIFSLLINETNFWQSSLFIFILSLFSGIIGYYIKHYIDLKKSKKLKILSLELIVGLKYTNGKYVIPSLGIKIENLSKADVSINYVRLKGKKHKSMASIDMIPKGNVNTIKVYEIKKFNYQCGKTNLIINPQTKNLEKEIKTLIQSPEEFFPILYNHLNLKTKPIKNKRDFEKRLSTLGVFVSTNIGNYFRKFTKKERKMFFKSTLMEQYDVFIKNKKD